MRKYYSYNYIKMHCCPPLSKGIYWDSESYFLWYSVWWSIMSFQNFLEDWNGKGWGGGGWGGGNGKFLMWRVYFLDKQKAEGWTGSKRKRKQTWGLEALWFEMFKPASFLFSFFEGGWIIIILSWRKTKIY